MPKFRNYTSGYPSYTEDPQIIICTTIIIHLFLKKEATFEIEIDLLVAFGGNGNTVLRS